MYSENMANFRYDLGFQDPLLYDYATVSYNLTLDHLKFWTALAAVTKAVLKLKLF